MASISTTNLSEETSDCMCFICSKKHKLSKSEKFCLECQQHFCSTCLQLHNLLHEDHSLQDPTRSCQGQLPTEKCSRHPSRVLEMFCKDHDELGCSTCAFTDHRSCVSVVDIPSTIQQLFDTKIFEEVKADLQRILMNLKFGIEAINEHKNKVNTEKQKHLSAIDIYIESLVTRIQNLGVTARQGLLTAYKMEEDRLHYNQTACESAENEVGNCVKLLETKQTNTSQLFVNMKKGLKVINRVNALLKEQSNVKGDRLPYFEKNCELENHVVNTESLGTVSKTTVLYNWKGRHEISFKTETDALQCYIGDLCFLPDRSLLLSDGNNKKLKRLNLSTDAITCYCDLPVYPRGLCCISPQEAAVCLSKKTIQFVSLADEKITLTRRIKLQHDCYGIDYHDNKLCVSNNGNDILLYSMDGTLLKSGNRRLSDTRNVEFSKSGDRVFVTDWNVGLVCVDVSLKELFRCNDRGISGYRGVCMDRRGSVFVSGNISHNVVQVTEAGQFLGEVMSKSNGMQHPHSLCWDNERLRLYVAGYSDTVTVFEE